MEKLELLLKWGGIKKDVIFLVLSGISLIASIFDLSPLPFNAAWIAIVLCGLPIISEALIGLITAFDIKADVLVSIALIASVIIGEDFAAGEVAFIMQLGALLEDLTVARARAGIEKLVHLTPRTARVIRNGREEIIPAEQVRIKDSLRVLPGETVPVDGIITSGQTSVDQSVMTGESMPVDKSAGDEIKSGTVNQFGAFEMEATHVGEDSSLQRMIRLVQSADAGKAKIVGIADRWATWIVIIALTAAVLTWSFTGEIIRAVTILVVFCPCALVLATPTAIMAAIGNATKYGILVRQGDALERLAQIQKITFDKTGTITYGRPRVVAVKSAASGISDDELYSLVASAELLSEHPLGKALTAGYKELFHLSPGEPKNFVMMPGRGVSANIGGKQVAAGNGELMHDMGIAGYSSISSDEYIREGCTVIYVAADGEIAGFAALSDTMREETAGIIEKIKSLGITPVLLTGDRPESANYIALEAGIGDVKSGCMPEDKLKVIDKFQQNKFSVCMVGDGVNDAPALKKSNVGIAMGGIGSDIAVDAADIVLVGDDISVIPRLIALSRRMMTTIKVNMIFSMGLNFAAVILAITGLLNPVIGALVHNAGSVLVIINSALLLKWRERK